MKKAIAAAAATAAAVTSSLIAILPPPQAVVPAVMLFSIPHPVEAADLKPAPVGEWPIKHLDEYVTVPRETNKTTPPGDPQSGVDVSAMKALVQAYAAKHGVNPGVMDWTVSCETGGTYNPTLRSFAIYQFSDPKRGIVAGEQEQSYGLAQIHLPDNPDVTLEQATDPDFALEFMASAMSRGEFWRWSCL